MSPERERMKNKLGKRKKNRTLLADWSEEKKFAVAVTVRPCAEHRFLKHFTIAIYLDKSRVKPSVPSQFVVE